MSSDQPDHKAPTDPPPDTHLYAPRTAHPGATSVEGSHA